MVKACFLDRDGVINFDTAYVHRWEEFDFVPGAVQAMRLLKGAGFCLIVVTNQSGIARGRYTEEQYQLLTSQLIEYLRRQDVELTAVYHCPHHPAGVVKKYAIDCSCRKPQPGMLLKAAEEHGIDLQCSFLVGDKPSDIEAARKAGVGRAYLVNSDNSEYMNAGVGADGVFEDLAHCVDSVLLCPQEKV